MFQVDRYIYHINKKSQDIKPPERNYQLINIKITIPLKQNTCYNLNHFRYGPYPKVKYTHSSS